MSSRSCQSNDLKRLFDNGLKRCQEAVYAFFKNLLSGGGSCPLLFLTVWKTFPQHVDN